MSTCHAKQKADIFDCFVLQILSFVRVGNKGVAELMDIGKQLLGR